MEKTVTVVIGFLIILYALIACWVYVQCEPKGKKETALCILYSLNWWMIIVAIILFTNSFTKKYLK